MSMLSPRLQLRVSQKQILTPGLVQMVTVLALNRLELKDMITQEIAENPVLEESVDGVEELTQQEVQALLESERVSEPSDQPILEAVNGAAGADLETGGDAPAPPGEFDFEGPPVVATPGTETQSVHCQNVQPLPFQSWAGTHGLLALVQCAIQSGAPASAIAVESARYSCQKAGDE